VPVAGLATSQEQNPVVTRHLPPTACKRKKKRTVTISSCNLISLATEKEQIACKLQSISLVIFLETINFVL
jgi:hypothetical protein